MCVCVCSKTRTSICRALLSVDGGDSQIAVTRQNVHTVQQTIQANSSFLSDTIEREIFVSEYFHSFLEMTFHLNYIFVFRQPEQ